MEIRCWKLDKFVTKLLNGKDVDQILDSMPDPTEEDFIKRGTKKLKHLLLDGKVIVLGPDQKISDYVNTLNIPLRLPKQAKHIRSKSSVSSFSEVKVKPETLDFIPPSSPAHHSSTTGNTSVDVRSPRNIEVRDPLFGLDWKEEILPKMSLLSKLTKQRGLPDVSDGMAALNLNPEGKGYYGVASSAEMVMMTMNMGGLEDQEQKQIEPVKPPQQQPIVLPDVQLNKTKKLALNKDACDSYVKSYFDFYHTSYPFIHKRSFMFNYMNQSAIPEEQKKSFEILKLTVFALGCWCLSDKDSTYDLRIYKEARDKLGSYVFEHGNLYVTQALILLSNYIQKRDFPNTGWTYLGTAVRHAIGLALHENIKGATPLEQEIRNRTWWGLYIFDVGTAITWGRPLLMPNLDEVKIGIIKNIPDEEFDVATDQTVLEDKVYPTIYSGFIAQIKLTHISSKIYNRTLSTKKLTIKESLELNKEIEEFSKNLPDYLSFNTEEFEHAIQRFYIDKGIDVPVWLCLTRYRLVWRVKNIQNVLFKSVIMYKKNSFFHRQDSQEVFEAMTLCLASSEDTIQSVTEYYRRKDMMHRLASWYLIYFGFQAIVIPMFCLLREPNSKFTPKWLHDMSVLRLVLLRLSDRSPLCNKFVKLIDGVTEKFREVSTDYSQPLPLAEDPFSVKRKYSYDGNTDKTHVKRRSDSIQLLQMPVAPQPYPKPMAPAAPTGGLINPVFVKNEDMSQAMPPAMEMNQQVQFPPQAMYQQPFNSNQDLYQDPGYLQQVSRSSSGTDSIGTAKDNNFFDSYQFNQNNPVFPMNSQGSQGSSSSIPLHQQHMPPPPQHMHHPPQIQQQMPPRMMDYGQQVPLQYNGSNQNSIQDPSQATINTLHVLFEDENVDSSSYLYSLNIQDVNQFGYDNK